MIGKKNEHFTLTGKFSGMSQHCVWKNYQLEELPILGWQFA